jgi:hypothetical protein
VALACEEIGSKGLIFLAFVTVSARGSKNVRKMLA